MTELDSSPPVYADHFWGEKHYGFSVLYDNMKKGEDTVNEIGQFIKERLSTEEEYTKLIAKTITKVSSFLSNGSAMNNGWSLTKGTLEILVDVQTMLVKNLQDLTKEVVKYKDDVAKVRKEAKQQEVIDAVNLMQTTTTCLQKAKETYHSRYVELEKIRKETNPNPKEIAKLELKLSKAKDEYKLYVDKYELVRIDFEEKMERACTQFQNHDRNHFAALQQFLLVYATHHQECASSVQQLCGQLRESLQQANVNDILANVIREKGTGMDRPQPATFEGLENGASLEASTSDKSSISSVAQVPAAIPAEMPDLLSLDDLDTWPEKKNSRAEVQPSPTASHSSDSTVGGTNISSSIFGSSLGGQKKLSMFMPKRKKTISQSSTGEDAFGESIENTAGGGIFKFRQNRRSKKSTSDSPVIGQQDVHGMEDAQSTASSSKSDEKQIAALHPFDTPNIYNPVNIDSEGYTVPATQLDDKEDTNWSSCSSDEEDENEMQKSKIKAITIKPAESVRTINASVDELRDAIGHFSIGRSSTFDKDPWNVTGKVPLFSQSLTGGSIKPLRPAHTADGRFRSNVSESEFHKSNVPLDFSASCGPAGLARARPRSNTPTHSSTFGLNGLVKPKESNGNNGSQDWGSSFGMNHSSSSNSLGESTFNLSQSTANLMQATISEQRIPIAMAVNEYSHAWFKGADITQRTVRCFGTIMISFASTSVPLLTDVHSDVEPLQFSILNGDLVKAVLPNKQILLPSSVAHQVGGQLSFTFDRLGLANWLLSQQKERPSAVFYNTEVIRYEMTEEAGGGEPPLLLTSYWKCEPDHTDIRIDYRLNTDCPITNTALLNLSFTTKVSGDVESVTSDPSANWNAETSTLTWTITELSRHGECNGSLKARVLLKDGIPSEPAQCFAQFQCTDASISGVSLRLNTSDSYHLSMTRRKVLAGKYFCEPEVRK